MTDLEFPAGYSQSACDIIASKFFRKKGVPGRLSDERGCEYSMRQLVHRMVSFWVDALYDGAILLEEQKQIVYDELAYMMLAQIWVPNSPQFFNTGLKQAYGIEGTRQMHFYYDEDKGCVTESSDAYTRTQGSACFILSVEDSLIGKKSLTDQLTVETLLFKYGSGVGANWSAIRAKNRINASNPCSEYMFLDDTACNLASINILKFYDAETDTLNIDAYLHTIMLIHKHAMKRVIHNHAMASSHKGMNFKGLSYEPKCIDTDLLTAMGFDDIPRYLVNVWDDAITTGEAYGYRNAQVTCLAPIGTIAFAMDCATTSSEPFFSHVAYKKLVGGNYMAIVNPVIPMALRRLGYNEKQVEDITNYMTRENEKGILDGKIEGAPHLCPRHYAIFDTASKCGTGSRAISTVGHVKMMAALTPHISGSISKTVNLDREAAVEDVKRVYKLAWELGVKAITIYRDGCKESQPLNTYKAEQKEKALSDNTAELYSETRRGGDRKSENIKLRPAQFDINSGIVLSDTPWDRPQRIKPSGIRSAKAHEAEVNGLRLYITTSFFDDGRLAEIYVTSGRQGSLTKGLLDSISTIISEMLQYGIPATEIARMYRGQKYEPSGIVVGHPYIKFVDSISDLISKIIDIEQGDFRYCQIKPDGYTESFPFDSSELQLPDRRFNDNDYIHGELCPSWNGTCKVCSVCGTTTGCS